MTPTEHTPGPAKNCPVCHGKGYLRCDCWPGDCICAHGDEDCEYCRGSGLDDWDADDDYPTAQIVVAIAATGGAA